MTNCMSNEIQYLVHYFDKKYLLRKVENKGNQLIFRSKLSLCLLTGKK